MKSLCHFKTRKALPPKKQGSMLMLRLWPYNLSSRHRQPFMLYLFAYPSLFVRQVSRDALCHIVLDVVVVEHIVFAMTSIRSEELGSDLGCCLLHRFPFCIRHNHAAGDIQLCVRTEIHDLWLAGFLVHHKRAQVLAGRRVCFIQLPIQWVDTLTFSDFTP